MAIDQEHNVEYATTKYMVLKYGLGYSVFPIVIQPPKQDFVSIDAAVAYINELNETENNGFLTGAHNENSEKKL